MCGILLEIARRREIDRSQFVRQLDLMTHRGPDDSGVYYSPDGRIALGSRRLAINDLSPAGHMPMHFGNDLWIVMNGEIYNHRSLRCRLVDLGHRFASRSDTEVAIAAYQQWGTRCLEHLDGMFAFAILDRTSSERGQVFIARDRTGEKPLYYWCHSEGFSCASELKSLLADPRLSRVLDTESFAAFLALGYVPGEKAIIAGICKLLPGWAAVYDVGTSELRKWQYWSAPVRDSSTKAATPSELCDELESLLLASVRDRLVADVPVGILLSGGLDSSLVTAAASAAQGRVKTFTVSFPGAGRFDETEHARHVASHFGTEHHEVFVADDAIGLLPFLASQYDEPLGDSSLLPTYLIARAIRKHATVALAGDGGDELFGGYTTYDSAVRRARVLSALPSAATKVLSTCAGWLPLGVRGRQYLSSLHGLPIEAFVNHCLFLDAPTRGALVTPPIRQAMRTFGSPESYRLQLAVDHSGDLVERATAMDFMSYLPDDVLVKVDRASMAVSLEVRAPFLATDIVEFSFRRVPGSLKADGKQRKILLKALASRLLPKDFDAVRKHGFSLPPGTWRRADWQALCRDTIEESDGQVFEKKRVRTIMRRAFDGNSSLHGHLFAIVMFELWRRFYGVTLS